MNISVPKDYFLLPKYLFTGNWNENSLVIYTVYKYTTAYAFERARVCVCVCVCVCVKRTLLLPFLCSQLCRKSVVKPDQVPLCCQVNHNT